MIGDAATATGTHRNSSGIRSKRFMTNPPGVASCCTQSITAGRMRRVRTRMSRVGFRLRAGLVPAPRGRQHGCAAEKRDDSRVVLIGQIAFGPPQSGPDRRISNWQRSVSEYSGTPGAMSVGGHTRSWGDVRSMTALPPKAEVNLRSCYVAEVPQPAVSNCSRPARLFDHLVGAGEQRIRNRHVNCLRGLEVDHQLELGRRLYRQIGGLLAPEDAIDV